MAMERPDCAGTTTGSERTICKVSSAHRSTTCKCAYLGFGPKGNGRQHPPSGEWECHNRCHLIFLSFFIFVFDEVLLPRQQVDINVCLTRRLVRKTLKNLDHCMARNGNCTRGYGHLRILDPMAPAMCGCGFRISPAGEPAPAPYL